MKILRKLRNGALVLFLLLFAAAVGYVLYLLFSYSRIGDMETLEVCAGTEAGALQAGAEYTAVSYNIGFGAYTADFTFFMDGGKSTRAADEESVRQCVSAAAEKAESFSPDFILYQEIDFNSVRSCFVDEREMLDERYGDCFRVFAVNYHSAYLFYPFTCPMGSVNSGLMTVSRYNVTSSLRRKLPVSQTVSRFLDLDRCYSVSRIPAEEGHEFILYNVHTSAYGSTGEIRNAQMKMLLEDMQREYEAGNWCVCGGDFNHDFTGDSAVVLNHGENGDFGWAQPFPEELLTGDISRATAYSCGEEQGSCRNCDVPYREGNPVYIVDGFLISANVEVTWLENVQTGYAFSDHNPVLMRFVLLPENGN